MADENVIGGVKVQVEGDFSPLQQDFQQAVAVAVQNGATLADAIAAASSGLDQSTAGWGNLNQALQQTQPAAQQAAAGVQSIGQAVQQTTPFLEQLKAAFKQLEDAWPNFANAVGNFIQHPLQSVGSAVQ